MGMSSVYRSVVAVTLGSLLFASACASDKSDAPALINYRPGKTSNLVGFNGELIDDDGCVIVQGRDASTVPLWPEGFTLSRRDGEATLMDANGQAVGSLGDEVRLGGGLLDRNGAEDVALGDIPEQCTGDRFFAVAQVDS